MSDEQQQDGRAKMEQFAARWSRVQPVVQNYVYSIIRRPQDVDDVVQEVAVTVCKDLDRFDESKEFLPWVLSIARFRAVDFQRRMGRDRLQLNTQVLEALEQPITDVSARDDERWAALNRCIDRLQPNASRVIRLRYSADMPVKDIAARLGKTPNAISIFLSRARATLLECVRLSIKEGR